MSTISVFIFLFIIFEAIYSTKKRIYGNISTRDSFLSLAFFTNIRDFFAGVYNKTISYFSSIWNSVKNNFKYHDDEKNAKGQTPEEEVQAYLDKRVAKGKDIVVTPVDQVNQFEKDEKKKQKLLETQGSI